MIYILHHPKGTLMMSAQDKSQVMKWSQRQLGAQARLVSISEKDFSETDGFVERVGTGISTREVDGCQPLMSIMATYVQNVSDAEDGNMESDANVGGPLMKGMMPTVH
jgi:hypothetical protein